MSDQGAASNGVVPSAYSYRLPFGRRRVGRGGRVIVDRSDVKIFQQKYGGLGYGRQHISDYENKALDEGDPIVGVEQQKIEQQLLRRLSRFQYDFDGDSDDETTVYLDQAERYCRFSLQFRS
jgi:hypothetical protein